MSDLVLQAEQLTKRYSDGLRDIEVLADLNQTGADIEPSPPSSPAASSITREMLSADLRNDLNRTVTSSHIAQNTITTAQLNEQILKYLKPCKHPLHELDQQLTSFFLVKLGNYLT